MEKKPAPEVLDSIKLKIDKSGEYSQKLIIDGIDRYFKVYVPSSLDLNKKNALIFALHGGGGDMTIQSNDKYYHQKSSAEKNGYILVFANGYSDFKSGKLATWNAGTCCGKAREKNIDDVKFLSSIVETLKNQISIDEKKVFFNGMSNGAMMSYKMACEKSSLVKGIMAVAGTDNTLECHPNEAVSILHIHAKDDDHVLVNGGFGPKAVRKASSADYNSVMDSINKWVKINQCHKTPKRVLEVKGAYCDLYSPCKNGTEVKVCLTDDGGHSWPQGEKPRGGKGSMAIDANQLMWDFFKDK